MYVMNKCYISPAQRIYSLNEESPLAESIAVINDEKVDNADNIGFVKGKSSENYDVWNEDWSK